VPAPPNLETTTMTLDVTCMLASLHIRSWGAEIKDRKISQDVADQHSTANNVGRYVKKLVAREAIQQIQRIASAARAAYYFNTLPWTNDGARILPASMWMEYTAKMSQYKTAYFDQVDAFVADYPNLVTEAQTRLNGMFKQTDYPDVGEIKNRFDFDFSISTLPNANDFRVQLARADVDQIKADIERRTTTAITDATRDTVKRMADVVEHLAERLTSYSGGRTGAFRDTLVDNVRDLVLIVPKLNITADPEMDRLAQEMDAKLCKYDASALREDVSLRVSVADEASAILAKLKAMGG
jgi:hypothetical protein